MRLRNWTPNLILVALGAAFLLTGFCTGAATMKSLVAGRRGVVRMKSSVASYQLSVISFRFEPTGVVQALADG